MDIERLQDIARGYVRQEIARCDKRIGEINKLIERYGESFDSKILSYWVEEKKRLEGEMAFINSIED